MEYLGDGPSDARGVRWWDCDDPAALGDYVTRSVKHIRRNQQVQQGANLRHLRMYRNPLMMGFDPQAYGLMGSPGAPLSLNMTRSAIDTVVSKLGKIQIKPEVQTVGGDSRLRERARKLERYIMGIFERERFYEKLPMMLRMACVFGTGLLKFIPDERSGRVLIENVATPEIIVDVAEGMHREPQNLYQVKWFTKDRAAALWPTDAEGKDTERRIFEANDGNPDEEVWWQVLDQDLTDMVMVVEAWHLPSAPGAKDGRHTIALEDITLVDEEWEDPFFPFVEFRWSAAPLGWHGIGLCEELNGIQTELNRLVRHVQRCFKLLSNPYVFVERSSGVGKGDITDIPGSFIYYSGNRPPQVHVPSTVGPEVFAQMDRLWARGYEIAGVGQMSAHAVMPTGELSGRAQLVNQDIQSDRFAHQQRGLEAATVASARMAVWGGRMLDLDVPVYGSEYESLKFSRDIDLDENTWQVRVMPASLMPDTPAGQLDFIERMADRGFLEDPMRALSQIDSPDAALLFQRATAPMRLIERALDNIIEGKEFMSPEPGMDLRLGIKLAQEKYAEYRLEGGEEERLSDLRRWIVMAERLYNSARMAMAQQQPMQAGPQPPIGPPPGALPDDSQMQPPEVPQVAPVPQEVAAE